MPENEKVNFKKSSLNILVKKGIKGSPKNKSTQKTDDLCYENEYIDS